jgi:hypothetical protein
MDRVAVAMSSRFEAFPRGPSGPPPRPKVEYATGTVVDEVGHVVTDARATEACEVITLTGLGPAERLVTTGDLALLRVYGSRKLTPVAFPDNETPSGSEVTLVGIPDPQSQGAGGAATTATARADTGAGMRRLDPAPGLGFSGAPALDARGRLAGVALLGGAVVAGPASTVAQARLVPADKVRAMLADNGVAIAAGAASSPDAAKASVVRVICVRK